MWLTTPGGRRPARHNSASYTPPHVMKGFLMESHGPVAMESRRRSGGVTRSGGDVDNAGGPAGRGSDEADERPWTPSTD